MIKKDLVIAVLATFCLTSALFMVLPTRSSTTNGPEYDPWLDLDDDGYIGLSDLVSLAKVYGTTGTPINKTELLLNVNATYTKLLSRINSLNASLLEQQAKIAQLESKIAVLNATKLGAPDWQQWVTLPKGQYETCYHNLGTTNVLVYMVGYDYDGYDYHQIAYGGDATALGAVYGAWWYGLTTTEIVIQRLNDDIRWDLIHIMIWKIP